MRYILSDREKWTKDKWFMDLSSEAKLLWIFLCENCNEVGFYELSSKHISYLTDIEKNRIPQLIFDNFSDKVVLNKDNTFLWIKKYLKHQKKDKLNPKANPHKQLIRMLQDGLKKGFQDCQDILDLIPKKTTKEANEEKNNLKTENKFIPPTIQELEDYFKEKGQEKYQERAFSMWHFYNKKGWMVGKNKMVSWKSACQNFIDSKWNNIEKFSKESRLSKTFDKKGKIEQIKIAEEEKQKKKVDYNLKYSE